MRIMSHQVENIDRDKHYNKWTTNSRVDKCNTEIKDVPEGFNSRQKKEKKEDKESANLMGSLRLPSLRNRKKKIEEKLTEFQRTLIYHQPCQHIYMGFLWLL